MARAPALIRRRGKSWNVVIRLDGVRHEFSATSASASRVALDLTRRRGTLHLEGLRNLMTSPQGPGTPHPTTSFLERPPVSWLFDSGMPMTLVRGLRSVVFVDSSVEISLDARHGRNR